MGEEQRLQGRDGAGGSQGGFLEEALSNLGLRKTNCMVNQSPSSAVRQVKLPIVNSQSLGMSQGFQTSISPTGFKESCEDEKRCSM